MKIKSDQLTCYIEGIKIPIKSIKTESQRNKLVTAMIEIPASEPLIPKMWANALIQVGCIEEQEGSRKEKLLFQGLCSKLDVMELKRMILVWAVSTFNSLNMNTTLDYTAPKKYSIYNLQRDDSKIFIGNESEVNVIPPTSNDSYQLAMRYFFMPDDARDLPRNQLEYSERMKIEYLANKTPFAERYAYTFFENIAYDNFILSRSYIERFNLLTKSKRPNAIPEANYSEQISISSIGVNFGMSGLYSYFLTNRQANKMDPLVDFVKGNIKDLTWPSDLTDAQIERGITNTFIKHAGFVASMIINSCKSYNINPFLVLGIGQSESSCGTAGRGARTHNPGNIGNTNSGNSNDLSSWENGWSRITKEIARRIKLGCQSLYNIAALNNDGSLNNTFPVYATLGKVDEEERNWRKQWADSVSSNIEKIKGNIK